MGTSRSVFWFTQIDVLHIKKHAKLLIRYRCVPAFWHVNKES